VAKATFIGIGIGLFFSGTKRHEDRNAILCKSDAAEDRAAQGESHLCIQMKWGSDQLANPSQASVNKCRHLAGVLDAHVEYDCITRFDTEPSCRKAIDHAF
jgi:hypothetical protein